MIGGCLPHARPARQHLIGLSGETMRVQDKSGVNLVRMAAVLLAASTALASIPAAAEGSGSATTTSANLETVRFGSWGVDLGSRDDKVKPGDDFQRYASGKWLDTHPIPADQASNGVGYETYLRNQERLQSIITGAPKDSQIGALYASYMDEPRLEQLDATPLKADLARVDAIKDKAEFTRDMARSNAD